MLEEHLDDGMPIGGTWMMEEHLYDGMPIGGT